MFKSSKPSYASALPGRSAARSAVINTSPLRMPWPTVDPFLFAVYHDDQYPAGNDSMGPKESLRGHRIGADFGNQCGWNMYHGEIVPGFPRHPHRGFETVTLTRHGVIDHADSLGSAGRFGYGDVQWMTAGRGVQHSEMFPLLDQKNGNRLELFQIWMNLPAADKMADPCYKMLWAEDLPSADPAPGVRVVTITGALEGASGPLPTPPPASYASHAEADVAIWTVQLAPRASWTLPAARSGAAAKRMLYLFKGANATVGGTAIPRPCAIELRADAAVELSADSETLEFVMLQAVPIGEPVVQHGPFVMTSQKEIMKAFSDYQRTGFGDWTHDGDAPVFAREKERFSRTPEDGLVERPLPR